MRFSELVTKDESVHIKRFTPAMMWMLNRLDHIANVGGEGIPRQIVITSANDGLHMDGSRHYMDEALDVRSKSIPQGNKELIRKRVEVLLNTHPNEPGKFIVILEHPGEANEHFHMQVRRGMSFGV